MMRLVVDCSITEHLHLTAAFWWVKSLLLMTLLSFNQSYWEEHVLVVILRPTQVLDDIIPRSTNVLVSGC